MKKRFEYRIITGGSGGSGASIRSSSVDILNKLGAEGWECFHAKTDTLPTVFYLKRER